MAAGRHEGHRDGESMDKEPEIDSSRRRDFYFYKGEKDRCRNRDSERESSRYRGLGREKGRDRTRELERETIRVRHRDLREIEANGGYHSSSSTSNSGSSGSHNKFYAKGADREPGELSSGSGSEEGCGYEEPARLQVRDADVQKSENGVSTLGRKRKYSPIVWDRDEMQTGNLVRGKSLVNSRDSVRVSEYSHTTDLVSSPLPPPPPLPQGYRKSPYLSSRDIVPVSGFKGSGSTPNNSSGLQVSPNKPSNAPGSVGSAASESPLASSPTSIKEQSEKNFSRVDHCRNQTIDIRTEAYWANDSEPGQLVESSMHEDEEEYMPTWNILASRWADENNSLVDEVSDGEGIAKGKKNAQRLELEGTRILSEQSVIGKVMSQSPELGEFMAEGFDGARLKSSGSDGEGSRGVNVSIGHDETASKEEDPGNDLGREEDLMEIDVEDVNDEDIDHESETDSEETVKLTPPPQRSINMLQGCRSVDEFEKLNKIDEGTYGVVFRAMDKKTKEIVALKKVKMEKETEGFPMTSLREINILLSFHHPSIVDVKEVVVGNKLDHIFMVMEYMEHDLKGLMETMKQPFSQSEVKCLMLQLFEGVKYLHDNWVLHRDLKTSNLLLNNRGELKICDFGLARQYGSPLKPYTHLVVTLWYRAPELLLGGKQYSTAIDMWSLGCIMAELLAKEPLFPGKSEIDQLEKIYRTLGTPSEKIWPGFINLPGVKVSFVKQPLPAMGDSGQAFWYNKLRDKFPPTSFSGRPTLSEAGFDLLNKLLTYDPEKRITADDALKHEWFREVPLPKSKDFMPTFPASHAQDRRLRRIMKSPDPLEEQRRKELQQGELGTGTLFG